MNNINNTVSGLKSQAYSSILNICHLICGDNLYWRWSDKNNCYIPNSISKKEQKKCYDIQVFVQKSKEGFFF